MGWRHLNGEQIDQQLKDMECGTPVPLLPATAVRQAYRNGTTRSKTLGRWGRPFPPKADLVGKSPGRILQGCIQENTGTNGNSRRLLQPRSLVQMQSQDAAHLQDGGHC